MLFILTNKNVNSVNVHIQLTTKRSIIMVVAYLLFRINTFFNEFRHRFNFSVQFVRYYEEKTHICNQSPNRKFTIFLVLVAHFRYRFLKYFTLLYLLFI